MPHRQPMIDTLNGYARRYPDETSVVAHFQAFIHEHPDCFEREQLAGHITASAWVLDPDHDHALLLHHRKLDKWLQLGGHADGDRDTLAVASREVAEESGIADLVVLRDAPFDIDAHRIPARPGEPEHWHFDLRYLLRARKRQAPVGNHESKAVRWVPRTAIRDYTEEESVLRMARKSEALLGLRPVD